MRLDIIVPRYQEEWYIGKPLLDSIALQQGINMNDIKVIIVNDGKQNLLDTAVMSQYPFEVEYVVSDHAGVSATRNKGLKRSDADYVMFCDFDDCFCNLFGLYLVFQAMHEGYDAISSMFIEEHLTEEGYKIVRREHDTTFVHGKCYKRSYLMDNKLFFRENLTIHEDGYFNCIAWLCTENKKEITTPFYLWRWHDNSVACKGDNLFIYKTYDAVMKARDAIVEESFNRGYISESNDFVVKTVLDSFYDFQLPLALVSENKEIVKKAEKSFKEFYLKWRKTYHEANIKRVGELMLMARNKAYTKGFHVEQLTVREWLKHIMTEV